VTVVNVRTCGFGPLQVEYDDRVLAPRPWTLLQSRHAAAWAERAPAGPMIELHCGAGHIGQAAAVWSGRPLVQVDDDPVSCWWARRNAVRHAIPAEVRCQSIEELHDADHRFAVVLADPPYVPSAETPRFPEDPEHAIDGGHDGLDGLRGCLPAIAALLAPGGAAVLQVRGPAQAAAVTQLLDASPELRMLETVTVTTERALVTLARD
jgi:release factor glutamine methyltransferase